MYYVYYETAARLLSEEAHYNVALETLEDQDLVFGKLSSYGGIQNVKKLEQPIEGLPVLTKETYLKNL